MNNDDHALDKLLAAASDDEERHRLSELWDDLGRLPPAEPPHGMTGRFAWSLRRETPPARTWGSHWTAIAASLIIGILTGATVASLVGRAEHRVPQKNLQAAAIVAIVPHPSSAQRLSAIHALGNLVRTNSELRSALLDRVVNDPTPAVQLAAVEHLTNLELSAAETGILARALPELASPIVQLALLDLLITRDVPSVTAAVEKLSQNQNTDPLVRRHADRALSAITERTTT
jgi:hypothetical protein